MKREGKKEGVNQSKMIFLFFLAPMRISRRTRVSERVTERVTDLCFYIREFNILVPKPSVPQTFSSQDSRVHTHTHDYVILSTF